MQGPNDGATLPFNEDGGRRKRRDVLAPSLPCWQEAEKEDFGTLSLTLLFSSPLHRRQTETTLLTMQAHAPPRLQSDLLAWTIGFVDPSLAVGHMPRGY